MREFGCGLKPRDECPQFMGGVADEVTLALADGRDAGEQRVEVSRKVREFHGQGFLKFKGGIELMFCALADLA